MTEYLQTTLDKFTFKVATDRLYSSAGVWALLLEGRIRLGLSDFVQQRSGDVAFASLKPVGTVLVAGQDFADIETIKVNITFTTPVSGKLLAINLALDSTPECINQDPYGTGWLVELDAGTWETQRLALLDPQAYFEVMKGQAQEEMG